MDSFVTEGKVMPHKSGPRIGQQSCGGYTLIEVCICIAIIGILSAIAVPNFIEYRNRARIVVCITEIKMIEMAISDYLAENGELPDSLADVGLSASIDPWGKPYQYLRLDGGKTPGINGKRRRDKNANPVNSDYDLYSMGRDGKTAAQFTAKNARDDIVRANDGAYYGLAENH
ncbi:MAG: prepilin-type N-terminal cleavage/methylation domain-containing protein [Saprospiraceae bacterium]|nr:prepilin-type N-terminal cleavage/methylation domain-containing protein [Saprospiraceae bacterium]